MDTFKPKTILIEESPLETLKQDTYEEKGIIYP